VRLSCRAQETTDGKYELHRNWSAELLHFCFFLPLQPNMKPGLVHSGGFLSPYLALVLRAAVLHLVPTLIWVKLIASILTRLDGVKSQVTFT